MSASAKPAWSGEGTAASGRMQLGRPRCARAGVGWARPRGRLRADARVRGLRARKASAGARVRRGAAVEPASVPTRAAAMSACERGRTVRRPPPRCTLRAGGREGGGRMGARGVWRARACRDAHAEKECAAAEGVHGAPVSAATKSSCGPSDKPSSASCSSCASAPGDAPGSRSPLACSALAMSCARPAIRWCARAAHPQASSTPAAVSLCPVTCDYNSDPPSIRIAVQSAPSRSMPDLPSPPGLPTGRQRLG